MHHPPATSENAICAISLGPRDPNWTVLMARRMRAHRSPQGGAWALNGAGHQLPLGPNVGNLPWFANAGSNVICALSTGQAWQAL